YRRFPGRSPCSYRPNRSAQKDIPRLTAPLWTPSRAYESRETTISRHRDQLPLRLCPLFARAFHLVSAYSAGGGWQTSAALLHRREHQYLQCSAAARPVSTISSSADDSSPPLLYSCPDYRRPYRSHSGAARLP